MKSKVFFTKTITPESLINIYQALGVDVTKGGTAKVGVKVSTGEDGAKGYLKAGLIGPFVQSLNGTSLPREAHQCEGPSQGCRSPRLYQLR